MWGEEGQERSWGVQGQEVDDIREVDGGSLVMFDLEAKEGVNFFLNGIQYCPRYFKTKCYLSLS